MTAIPSGFRGAAIAAGLKPSGKPDLGLIVSDTPASGAALFTTNRFAGANIAVNRRHLGRGAMRALVVHAGQANACTGMDGIAAAEATARYAAEAAGCKPTEVLVGSTGVIGVLPKLEKLGAGLKLIAAGALEPEGVLEVGRAMMTTDLVPKTAFAEVRLGRRPVRLLGIAKGSGMIHPSMATMLAYVFTDAAVPRPLLKRLLGEATDRTFNCLTVDGDTSTSDMVAVFANGASGAPALEAGTRDAATFAAALTDVCAQLARAVAADGEGATRLVTVRVRKAATESDARKAAKAVAGSSLVKCAIFGHDPNWGRIACAVGYSGARFDPTRVTVRMGETVVFAHGQPATFDRSAVAQYLNDSREIAIEVSLGAGAAEARAWTCDLTYDYVRINAEYTT